MSFDPRWRVFLDALEETRDALRLDGRDAHDLLRLARVIEQRAALHGHLDVSDAAADLRTADDVLAASEPVLCALRDVAVRCVHRRGTVALITDNALADDLHAALEGLEHRVGVFEPAGLLDLLDDDAAAGLILEASPDTLDLLARLRLDPRSESLPIVVLLHDPSQRATALALGASSVLRLPLAPAALVAAVATLLGQQVPGVSPGLPDRQAFTRTLTDVAADARRTGESYTVLLAHPLGIRNAREVHGSTFIDTLLAASAEQLRAHVGSLARMHALDHETLAWVSRANGSDLHDRLQQVTDGGGLPVPTPGGSPWFNRLAVGGVVVRDTPLERAVQGARRMLALAVQAGGAAPVVTPLDAPGAHRHRALMFEPDALNAEVLLRELERLGIEVVRATEPVEALTMARSTAFSLLLTAVDGPAGVRLVKGLRSLDGIGAVLAVSPDTGSARSALVHGADDVVMRPVDPVLFAARMRARLRGSEPSA